MKRSKGAHWHWYRDRTWHGLIPKDKGSFLGYTVYLWAFWEIHAPWSPNG